MVSSFVPRILTSIIAASTSTETYQRDFIIQSLCNRGGVEDPHDYATQDQMTGVNIYYEYLTPERVKKVHSTQNFIGLWYVAVMQTEDVEMWSRVFLSGGGVDFFYSDKPLEAMATRDSLQLIEAIPKL